MAFNPSLPTELTIADAAQMRAQFTGLFDLTQTIPVGPAGPRGEPGVSVMGAVVDGVTTGNAGTPAAANAAFDGANVRFTHYRAKVRLRANGDRPERPDFAQRAWAERLAKAVLAS